MTLREGLARIAAGEGTGDGALTPEEGDPWGACYDLADAILELTAKATDISQSELANKPI